MSSAETTTEEQAAPVVDTARDELVAALVRHLGDAVLATQVAPGQDAWARVDLGSWDVAARVSREQLGLTYFCYLSAIDWLPSPYGRSEDDSAPAAPPSLDQLDHGVAGGATRFQLLARLVSPTSHLGIHLKCDLPDDDLRAPTWSRIFPGADWNEREIHEMFGITFDGHPNLANLYLPGGFEGYPLRKDFPLLSRMVKPWPGLVDVEPMPGEPDEDEEAAEAGDDE